jgi:probable addiction module antidote protein
LESPRHEPSHSHQLGRVIDVLGDVARSEGMTKIAEKTGVNRQALYTALSENGNPTLETLLKVMAALGIRLKCEAVEQAKAA